jgi:NADH-quinone oxidoreductase subunit B
MAAINQINANRRNAKKSTGPKTEAGKDRVRFNALVHGLRAESTIFHGEDRTKFDQLLEQLTAAWMPQDDMEKTLVERIAVNQWKLARLDRSEAMFYDPGAMKPAEHRIGGMDAPFASGPVELFERLDNETVASAAAAASEGLVLTTLDMAVNWARKNSIWPMSFGLACCAIEMMSMSASRFDIARFGAEVFRGSPRQSDLMIIAGRVSNKMAPVIRHLYQQMPEPKWAISMGACATSTGVFNNYALIPVNQVIPIDVYVPGCPPRPEQLIQALMMLQSKIQNESGTVRQILNLAYTGFQPVFSETRPRLNARQSQPGGLFAGLHQLRGAIEGVPFHAAHIRLDHQVGMLPPGDFSATVQDLEASINHMEHVRGHGRGALHRQVQRDHVRGAQQRASSAGTSVLMAPSTSRRSPQRTGWNRPG